MAWLPESLNKHRAPSPEEIRANQGLQNPLSGSGISNPAGSKGTRLGEVLGSHSRSSVLLGRQRSRFRSISPSKQLGKRHRKAFSGRRSGWMPPQRLRALAIPGLWGLSMGSLHDIHHKAGLGKNQRVLSNLSAPKETPAALNSVCGAKKALP